MTRIIPVMTLLVSRLMGQDWALINNFKEINLKFWIVNPQKEIFDPIRAWGFLKQDYKVREKFAILNSVKYPQLGISLSCLVRLYCSKIYMYWSLKNQIKKKYW